MAERDRTAMAEPLTVGQRIVAKWEGPASDWSEPADLADAIDAAIADERKACATIAANMAHESKIAMQNFRLIGDDESATRHDHYRTRATVIHHAILARGESTP